MLSIWSSPKFCCSENSYDLHLYKQILCKSSLVKWAPELFPLPKMFPMISMPNPTTWAIPNLHVRKAFPIGLIF